MFKQLKLGSMDNFSYIIGDNNECFIFDPGWEVEKLVSECEGYKIKGIIITHVHWDHIQELDKAVKLTNALVYVHENGIEEVKGDVKTFKDGDVLTIGNINIKVIHTPGHNPSCCCFLFGKKLITGDTLFVEGCGRCDLEGSDIEDQWNSLQRLKELDDDIEVYTGHDYGSKPVSTIGYEKKNNKFLTCDKKEFINVRMG
jgi:hydroxyacylglutathione hydrolase